MLCRKQVLARHALSDRCPITPPPTLHGPQFRRQRLSIVHRCHAAEAIRGGGGVHDDGIDGAAMSARSQPGPHGATLAGDDKSLARPYQGKHAIVIGAGPSGEIRDV